MSPGPMSPDPGGRAPRALRLPEPDARDVLLLAAFESPPTPPWTADDREAVGSEARRAVGERADDAALLAARAQLGLARLGGRDALLLRALQQARAAATWPAGLAAFALALGAVLGAAADAVGGGGRIHLLAPPLLGLLAWNLGVYAWLAWRAVARVAARAPAPDAGPRPAGPMRSVLAHAVQRFVTRPLARLNVASLEPPRREAVREAFSRFGDSWIRASAGLAARRATVAVHLAAAGFAAGALASLYGRGLGFEYRAGWDSTFLDAPQALGLLHLLLGPASALTGLSLPSGPDFEALRFSAGPGEVAARWIHLWAVTLAGVVIAPRLLLAALAAASAARQARAMPLPDDGGPWATLLRPPGQRDERIWVLPFGTALGGSATRSLQAVLERATGARVEWFVGPATPEGNEDAAAALDAPAVPCDRIVAALRLAWTPERETHGRFLDALAARCRRDGQDLAVLIDEAGFSTRLPREVAAQRRAERREAWQRLAAAFAAPVLFVDLDAPELDSMLPWPGLRSP
jgi:hypothetical protein